MGYLRLRIQIRDWFGVHREEIVAVVQTGLGGAFLLGYLACLGAALYAAVVAIAGGG